jgi:hypothetical protein
MTNVDWKYSDFAGRYIIPEEYHARLQALGLASERIGRSFEGNPLELYKIGSGSKKVLIWSQMHGNEPTGTLSMLDILTNHTSDLTKFENLTIYYLPMLNPDGALRFTRRNAQELDINRDARDLSTPEGKILMEAIEKFQPELCLNLHDQRTCFSAGEGSVPAVFAVLAPSAGNEQPSNEARKKAIGLLNAALIDLLPNENISRFTDEYYPTAFGDRLQAQGFSNILLEAGARYADKNRLESRELMGRCILSIIKHLSRNNYAESNAYDSLPLNKEILEDIILRSVIWKVGDKTWNGQLALRRTESVVNGTITYGIKMVDQGDLAHKFCHVEVHEEIELNAIFPLESDLTQVSFNSQRGIRAFSEFI